MGRTKGSKNKPKEIEEIEVTYSGHFLLDSGLKLQVHISEDECGDEWAQLADSQFPFDEDDIIWLGEEGNLLLRAKKIVGWYISED